MVNLLVFGLMICANISLSTAAPHWNDQSSELFPRRISPPGPNVYICPSNPLTNSESIGSCHPNPCKNGGTCINEGAELSCRCPIGYGGPKCEELKGECVTYGDPHYFTFNKQRFDFMGKGRFVLSEDCVGKTFKLRMTNDYCARRRDVTCLVELLIQFKGNIIRFYRGKPEIALNQKKYILTRPMCGKGFILRRVAPQRVILTTDFGLEIEWNGDRTVRVFLLERYKGKTCGLCGNYGVNDNNCGAKGKCNENTVFPGFCLPGRGDFEKKCDLMLQPPFQSCYRFVNPNTHIQDCKFDACRCSDPWDCVCSAFATYSKDCADDGKVLSWRYGSKAYQPLNKCVKTCSSQQVFTECGSSCVKTCRDLSSSTPCDEECVAECRCPNGQLLNDHGNCISKEQCPCHSGSDVIAPGKTIKIGMCKTCTCKSGLLDCNDDCAKKPCDSFPCKNGGTCFNDGDSFSCKCSRDYRGKNCQELKPRPCDSSPCKNGGTCFNKGDSFSCKCKDDYQGIACEVEKNCRIPCPKIYKPVCGSNGKTYPNECVLKVADCEYGKDEKITVEHEGVCGSKKYPCDFSPCKNGGKCTNQGDSFTCECPKNYKGDTCEEYKLKPCDSSPCKNGGVCTNEGDSFSCGCRPNFIGATCETGVKNPCKSNPCKNRGQCVVLGNAFSCRCKPNFGGPTCEHGQSLCEAHGDPHYTTFDKRRFNFMGKCDYVFAQDCSPEKAFTVVTKNIACGRGAASCTSAVTVHFAGYRIRFTRQTRTAIINGVKVKKFPIRRPGFVITNPTLTWLRLTTNIGLTVYWNCKTIIRVTVSGKYKGKTCGLCGNNDGNRQNDQVRPNLKCAPKPNELKCRHSVKAKPIIAKCGLMKNPKSPFTLCHGVVDPTNLVKDCRYDACRCDDPMECVCAAFATYSKQCSDNGKIIDWRFKGTYLYEPLKECAKQCPNAGEIFTECGSSCAQTCRDLSRDIQCNEECVPGCQCPAGQLLNDKEQCVPTAQCPCHYEGGIVQPGQSVEVGNCKTCTCNGGAMACVSDRKCAAKGPCDSSPCKNEGICSSEGDSFSCKCLGEYEGKTCEELKPQPCDSSPCQNGGVCSNEGDSFFCECEGGYYGKTCEEIKKPKPCDSSPCENGGKCENHGDTYACKCTPDFTGKTCKESTCKDGKLDLLFVVDGSGSVRKSNFLKIKKFIKDLSGRFDIGLEKTRVAFMQFGRASKTRLEFQLGRKDSLAEVTKAIDRIRYLRSRTDTGDALRKAREEVFSGKDGDRPEVGNVLLLFTDGQATDKDKTAQLKEAEKLKNKGVEIITVAMGKERTIKKFRHVLKMMASKASESEKKLAYEAKFSELDSISNNLIKESCKSQKCTVQEVVASCDSSCALTCRDLSRDANCGEECGTRCRCPKGELFNVTLHCIPIAECPCYYEGKDVSPGGMIAAGKCRTCICTNASMHCEDKSDCEQEPCDSSPCKNGGICTNEGDSFSCACSEEFEGKTCSNRKPKPCHSSPCQNGGTCTNDGDSYSCECPKEFSGDNCEEAKCKGTKLDLLLVVDGSGSVRKANFAKIKEFIERLNKKFDVGPDKTRIALMQFGEPAKTRIEFNLGDKSTLEEVNDGVKSMNYLRSQTATGDALRKAGEEVFNGKDGDRPDAPDVLILFTDGQATDKGGKNVQVEEAHKLKDKGVKVITVGMGEEKTIAKFRSKLMEMASKASGSDEKLEFEADFEQLDSISNALVKEACNSNHL